MEGYVQRFTSNVQLIFCCFSPLLCLNNFLTQTIGHKSAVQNKIEKALNICNYKNDFKLTQRRIILQLLMAMALVTTWG